jgi:hypothetical protein
MPVTFGTREKYRTESLDFDISYITLPYNAILGYPALAKFMAAMHHGFNVLKIPSAHGTISMHCNEKDALRSVEYVYREAATMFPADVDLLEHSCHKSGLPPRKLHSSRFYPVRLRRSLLHLHQPRLVKISSILCWT